MDREAVDQFRATQKAVWGAGDFDSVAKLISWRVGPVAVAAASVGEGDELADLACGTGNVAIQAAQAGAKVTGLDISPDLIEKARVNAASVGIELDLVEGDAAELPFEDERFDAVTSVFGIQFAPRQRDVAHEIARILRSNGRAALINWTPSGFVGRTLAIMSGYLPSPPDFVDPPPTWGVPEHVNDLFEGTGLELEHSTGGALFEYESPEGFVDFMSAHYGPQVIAKQALGDRWEDARHDLIEMSAEFNRSDDALELEGEYLLTVATKGG